jgi:hypothetical protein
MFRNAIRKAIFNQHELEALVKTGRYYVHFVPSLEIAESEDIKTAADLQKVPRNPLAQDGIYAFKLSMHRLSELMYGPYAVIFEIPKGSTALPLKGSADEVVIPGSVPATVKQFFMQMKKDKK